MNIDRPAGSEGQPDKTALEGQDTGTNDAREEKRARVYGLGLKDLLDESIIVGPGKYVRLSGSGLKWEGPGLARLQPKGIDDVKRWIGVPDELGAKSSCCREPAAELPGIANPGDIRKLDVTSQRALRDLASQYVHGDSRRVAKYRDVLAHLVDRAVINGIFLRPDIEIHKGAVLEIGRDIKILFARHIRIWRGGLLKLTGDTKIDCVSITGNLLELGSKVDKIPAFGTVIQEVANG